MLDRGRRKRRRNRRRSQASQTTESAESTKSGSAESTKSGSTVRVWREERRSSIARRRNTIALDFANVAFAMLFELATAHAKWYCSNRSTGWYNGYGLNI